ncbi:MmyB family transcriptional regulator [Actinoplanes octamycinicus]
MRHEPAPVRASLRAVLDGMPLLPAYVVDFRFDVLAANPAAAALFGPGFGTGLTANTARALFLDDRMRDSQLDWPRIAREMVGNLRANLARHPGDGRLREVIDELRRSSADFADWWRDQTVAERTHGRKRIQHPEAGPLTVCYDVLGSRDGADQYLFTITPAGPADERKLRELITRHSRFRLAAI